METVFWALLRRFFSLRMRAFFPGTRMNWFVSGVVFWVVGLVLCRWRRCFAFLWVSFLFLCMSFRRMFTPFVRGMGLYMIGLVIICSSNP